jgi:pyruvate ferredoxin oxidoreductase delta subunit
MGTRDCRHICGESSPGIGEGGKTGEWRSSRPVIDQKKCLPAKQNKPACFQCWLYCPDAVISKTIPIKIDLEYCKGCGICEQVCPAKAIAMVREATTNFEQNELCDADKYEDKQKK